MVAFQFYLQSGKQIKVSGCGIDNHVAFGKKFCRENGSVRWYVVIMQQPVLLSPKFGGETFAYFHSH
jgi:hypothetical protein